MPCEKPIHPLAKHFVVIAPGVTVFERLREETPPAHEHSGGLQYLRQTSPEFH